MKKILLPIIALITVFSTVKAQTDFCKDITKKTTPENLVIYASPVIADQFQLAKTISDKGATLYLRLTLGISDDSNAIKEASITFEDDSVINFADLKVDRTSEKDIIGNYVYITLLSLSTDDIAKLKTAKIKSYLFLGKKRVPSPFGNVKNKIMAYANCMDALNDGPPPIAVVPDKKSIDGFWGITFGSSPADVKAAIIAKGGKLSEDDSKPDNFLFTNAVFTQRNTDYVATKFINDKFYQADVTFPAFDDINVIPTFNNILSELTNVYGPAKVTKTFQAPYHEGDGLEAGAVRIGMASYLALWKTNNGNTLTLQINKDETISLFYTDKTLEKAKDAKKSNDY